MGEVIIYGKNRWPYTRKAREAYAKQADTTVVYVDVLEDPKGMEAMLKASKGKRAVPVIVEHGRVAVGYGGT